MDKTYDPKHIEQHWYQLWETNGYFKPRETNQSTSSYCIVIPPPNVTGTLHMGHGFQDTLMDVLIRYHRMCGENTLWQVGTDHAGIATQMVVERQLNSENKTREQLGRDAFVKRVWQWKVQSGSHISQQIRRMGCSTDWTRERFTLDEQLSDTVKHVFVSLYREGLIYRGKRLVNWDPTLCTAVSDLEVVTNEEAGKLWHIHYPLTDGNDQLTIATTRPETLLGDVAVAVHPTDPRYQDHIGKSVRLPLTDREIPIIADDYVDPEFGTGCVKITPAHDFNDYAIGLRHQLPLINIFTETAHINQQAPRAYQGLERYAAREQILANLTKLGLLANVIDHTLSVPRCERTHAIVEPYLTDQWFVKATVLAKPAIAAVKQDDIEFVPKNWEKTYFQWMDNIEDWCISRQLWWGHRIPAWYDDNGNVYVGDDEAAVRKHYDLADTVSLSQDTDVLDTWFSSALWPFSTLGWPEKTTDFQQFYPTNVLVTGFDIIFFWVARMIMMGLKFTGQVPFNTVYITGLIRDHDGHKMSKSKGNVLDPIDLIDGIALDALIKKRTQHLMQPTMAKQIEKVTRNQFPNGIASYGTDALRFTYCALASTGRDIRFDVGRLEGYRNFCNKLWNATRYVLMNVADTKQKTPSTLTVIDQWILARLNHTIAEAHQHIAEFRFDLLANCLYEFIWNEYCDWYLELSKPVLLGKHSDVDKTSTRYTLITVLDTVLRLLHPLMPFITEEIWQRVTQGSQGDTIMLATYPQVHTAWENNTAIANIDWLKQVITTIRTIRSEMNVAPSKQIELLVNKGNQTDHQRLQQLQPLLIDLANISTLRALKDGETPPPAATGLVGDLELLIPMQGLIDTAAELARLNNALTKTQKELDRAQAKLANPNYINKAPADVVSNQQRIAAELQTTVDTLNARIQLLTNIT